MKSSSKVLLVSVAILSIVAVAIVAVYATPPGGSANASSGRPDYFTWIGVVTDSNSRPLAGVTVTLHLMTPSGEASSLTNRTIADTPYPGSYAFYDVPLPDGVTYAYAVADSGDLGGGVHCFGQTNNIEINKSILTSGILFLNIPGSIAPPDNGSANRVIEGWFGTVIDSSSRPMGNVNVTLHLMSPDGEVAAITTQSISSGQYPGSFVFDNVSLPDNAMYGYVTVDTGNGTNPVRSNDYALNKSRISSGFLVL
jgi:hypothetical protein